MQTSPSPNYFRCHAARRDAPVTCPACGRRVTRKARQQIFCSRRCRQRANYAKAVAEGRWTAPPTKPSKKANGLNGLQARKGRSSISPERWRAIVEVEIFGGRRWQAVVSSDGVSCQVSQLRPRALRDGGAA
jgi:hypothetical protein